MPKAEKGTAKYLANKMKAKGLQKLRWFCQMCQKQCRDENGFKCHTTSESHQRQLLLFADNPHRYLDEFSKEFVDGYMELLRRRFGTRRVSANQVYQEYIADRDHLHMNATKWLSLTGFVKWLGTEGKCVVDETEKGWFVTYIDRDPETIARQQASAKKEKMDKDDEERIMDFVEKQVERAKDGSVDSKAVYTELQRTSEEEKIVLKLATEKAESTKKPLPSASAASVFKVSAKGKDSWETSSSRSSKSQPGKRKSALEEIREEQEKYKQKKYRKDYWLIEGIVVKVITRDAGDKYYNQKGVVTKLFDQYTAVVKLLDCGTKLKLDQNHLQTCVPAVNRDVRIVNGEFRGCVATMISINIEKYCSTIVINVGPHAGKTLRDIPYEDFSRMPDDQK